MKKTVILSGARTPIGSFLGSLSSIPATSLGALAIKASVAKSQIDVNDIDQVIMGQVLQGGSGQAPARQASLLAGLSNKISCTTVNKVCGSGLKAIMMGADAITLGTSKAAVCGGMESMSNAPYILPQARTGFRMGNNFAVDLMLHDGLFDPYGKAPMGSFGDRCAKEHGFSRQAQDEYANESYQKALDAQEKGFFDEEIISIDIKNRSGSLTVAKDEEPSRYQPEKMASLKPAFDEHGTVTVANASKINDGAAAVVLMEEGLALSQKKSVAARIIASATFAHEPEWFTTAPAFAIKKALAAANLKSSDIDLYEINEAFSVVAMTAMKDLSLKRDQVNIFGGAVALGHPIGASGARLMVTMLNALKKRQKRLGCVALCLGGGEAVAMIVERVS